MNSREGGPLDAAAFPSNASLGDELQITPYRAQIQQAVKDLEREGLIYGNTVSAAMDTVYAATPSPSEYN